MQKRLFLTGPSGCGKTTMIREALGEKLAECGGFVTERVFGPGGALLGDDLLPAAAAAGVSHSVAQERDPPALSGCVCAVGLWCCAVWLMSVLYKMTQTMCCR